MRLIIKPEHVLFLLVLFLSSGFIPPKIILGFFFLVVFPGYAISNLVLPNASSVQHSIFSVGIGLPMIALAVYLLGWAQITITQGPIIFIYLVFYLAVILLNKNSFQKIEVGFQKTVDWTKTILIIVLLLGLITRVEAAKDIYAPPFADPVVDSTISRLIVDNGKIPQTWQPFLDMKLNRQVGFPSIIAWFNIFTGVPIQVLVLYLTNIFQALIPVGIYALAFQMTRNAPQALMASIIALLAAFPAFIFIAGLNSGVSVYLVLIVSLSFSMAIVENISLNGLALLCLMFAGAFLIHPVYAFLFLLLFIPFSIFSSYKNFGSAKKHLLVALALLMGILFTAPYFIRSVEDKFGNDLAAEQWKLQADYINPAGTLSPLVVLEPFFFLFNNLDQRWYYYPENMSAYELLTVYKFALAFILIFAFSIFTVFTSRDRAGYMAISWFLLFVAFSYVQGHFAIKFPFWHFIYPTRIKFLLALPVAILLSFAFAGLKNLKIVKFPEIYKIPVMLFLVLAVIPFELANTYSGINSIADKSPMKEGEMLAIEWIGKNTEPNATVLNFVTDMEPGSFIGDAGQWIPVIAGRAVVFPATTITDFDAKLESRKVVMSYAERGDVDGDDFLSLLKKYGADYVFVSVHSMQSRNLFKKVDPDIFLNSNRYRLEYNGRSEAFVFKVLY